MSADPALTLALLGAAVVMFALNRPRMDGVALMALAALPLAGLVTLPEALAGFAAPNIVLSRHGTQPRRPRCPGARRLRGLRLLLVHALRAAGARAGHRLHAAGPARPGPPPGRRRSPRTVLAALFAATALMRLFISNTATAVLMAPIALAVAGAQSASPLPFAMTVALAASAAFMTPVSSPVNTLVVGPGGYTFLDFVRLRGARSVAAAVLSTPAPGARPISSVPAPPPAPWPARPRRCVSPPPVSRRHAPGASSRWQGSRRGCRRCRGWSCP